ncbi:MAG: aldo/keto reductase, partial [Rhodothermales bacterium]
MQTRTLGYTGIELTTVGLGTWAIGGGGWKFGWGPQEDSQSVATIHRALDLGINWIDTARIYGLGHSESVVGEAIRGRDVFVATKCGRQWHDDGTIYSDLREETVRKECESSLRRLGRDVIDLYQIHWPNPESDIEEGWSAVARLVEEGKVRFGGVCNFSIEQLERIRKIHPVASLQPPYSMLRRDVEVGLLDYCARHDIGIVAYSPMLSGLLTGKYTEKTTRDLPEEDWRKRSPHFLEPELSINAAFVE